MDAKYYWSSTSSILGPLLFNIFLNDLLRINQRSDIHTFADDNTLYYCGVATENVIKNVQSDLKILYKSWKDMEIQAFGLQ